MPPTTLFLSVVIPLYNEEKRAKNIRRVISYLSGKKISWELILVNDGSTDGTGGYIAKFKNKNIKTISYPVNRGKGYAIKRGMLAASGEYRLFMDVDLATPIEALERFIPLFGKYDCLIGTRKAKGARVSVHQPWLRENLGKGFTFLSRVFLGVSVSDFTCGFKCFSAESARAVFGLSSVCRWGFDAEILFLYQRLGYTIKEIPVTWKDDKRTRVKFPQDIFESLNELLTIRLNAARGLYAYQKNR